MAKHSAAWEAQPLHFKLVHTLTEYDRKQSGKRGYNPYALAHYLGAVQRFDELVKEGKPTRQALCECFCGRLLDLALKTAGEQKSTDAEQRSSL